MFTTQNDKCHLVLVICYLFLGHHTILILMNWIMKLLCSIYNIFILLVLVTDSCVVCLHLEGTWESSDNFYIFLAKFGFQKTDLGKLDDSQGFIYGNITADNVPYSYYTMVVVDSKYFMELHGNSTAVKSQACPRMFNTINKIAYYPECNSRGKEDFLRRIPCEPGKLCIDEDNPANVLPGYQFTYRIQDVSHARFWYLSLVACHREDSPSCRWTHNASVNVRLKYDIWMVNGDPASKHLNPFEHQFSFELHDVFEIYAIFTVLYTVVLPVWIYAYKKQIHPITKLLTVCISTEFTGVVFNFLHVLIFSFNGVGAEWLKMIGNLLGIFAECMFMLLLLLIAKGWTITSMKLTSKPVLFGIWGFYTALNGLFFIISLTKIDVISNIDEWNAWPGYLIVSFRTLIMVWFIIELRRTAQCSQHQNRIEFFQQFGAYYLVWFIYLPVLVIVATQISYLWRYKTLLSITYAADLLSYVVLIHLLWPSISVLYLIKADAPLPQYDLECAGLIDDMEETLFTAPSSSQRNKDGSVSMPSTRLGPSSGSKTNLLDDTDLVTSLKLNGSVKTNGRLDSINLDEDEEFELL